VPGRRGGAGESGQDRRRHGCAHPAL